MKPYYEDSLVTLFCADCRDVLPTLTGVDAVVADPPYGIGLRNGDVDGHRSKSWDRIIGDGDGQLGMFVIDWARANASTIAVFASPWNEWPGPWRNRIVWDKGGAVGGGGDIDTCLKRSWELLQVWNAKPINGPRAESVWRYHITPHDTQEHIATKPLALMTRVLTTFTTTSELVVDPTAGIGSTLEAAKRIGQKAIGIEIEERYCEIAARRLSQGALTEMFL